MFVLNNRYYFDEKGNKVIPTDEDIRKAHNLDDKFYVAIAEFPNTGYAVTTTYGKVYNYLYETFEEGMKAKEEMIQAEIAHYRSMIR